QKAVDFYPPQTRTELYDCVLQELLKDRPMARRRRLQFGPDEVRPVLCALSYVLFERGEGDRERFGAAELARAADSERQKRFYAQAPAAVAGGEPVYSLTPDGDALLDELVKVAGILRAEGKGRYRFAHRTLQEYLAASWAVEQQIGGREFAERFRKNE